MSTQKKPTHQPLHGCKFLTYYISGEDLRYFRQNRKEDRENDKKSTSAMGKR